MAGEESSQSIDIRPTSGVYATYRRLSYKPWYAIAEFVDNSTQNYFDHRKELLKVYASEGRPGKLRVQIDYDAERNALRIHDNANGMAIEELGRAVALDRPPPVASGRCEFGMGLKTAACWFGSSWTIETKHSGSRYLRRVTIDVPTLVAKHSEQVRVEQLEHRREAHFTTITIRNLFKPIRGRTPERIRLQLGSMYRHDLRSGEIEILWNGIPVVFEEPKFLEERIGKSVTIWRKSVSFSVRYDEAAQPLKVSGWVGIRVPGSQRDAGFVLMRRGRVIIGGPGEGYKPVELFGQGNTFRSQRLVGELNLDDWPVTQAKDAFDWSGGLEDEFIAKLGRAAVDYMEKCEGYRKEGKPITIAEMSLASESTRKALSDRRLGAVLSQEANLPDPRKAEVQAKKDVDKLRAVGDGPVVYRLQVSGQEWVLRLHWQDSISDAHWMSVSFPDDTTTEIVLNMAHPFFAQYLANKGFLEIIQKFVVAMAIAERMARRLSHDGSISPGDFRNFMNKILRHTSEIEVENGW